MHQRKMHPELMIQETIKKIEQHVQGTKSMPAQNREDLLELLETLKEEVEGLSETDAEQAQSLARFFDLSTHEATRSGKNPKLLQLSLDGLSASVDGFEQSHPKLVALVNRVCTTLSNLGV
jgi:hypothetical protein